MSSARAAATPSSLDESLLVLFDGHALFHRAFHAIKTNLSVSKTGEPTNAVYGFTSSLLKTLSSLRPACAAVAFDRPTPTFRHRAYAEYKATRPAMPDEMRAQFGRIRQVVDSLGLPIFELDGFEADDILGCLAQRATAQGLRTVIVTGDTDTMQLVSPTVHVLLQRGLQAEALFDLAAVRERYGLDPAQIAHLKGLRGDPSDNIPGVSGIGDKTATALLQQFGTVPGVYESLELVSPERLRERLRQGELAARQGLELATIVTDLPLSLDLLRLRWAQGFDRPRVVALFRELEFMSLLPRLPEIPSAPVTPSPSTVEGGDGSEARVVGAIHESPLPAHHERTGPTDYRTVLSQRDLEALLQELAPLTLSSSKGALALHVQTTSADLMQADIVGLAVAWAPGVAAYVPLTHAGLHALLEDEAPAKVLHVAREALSPLANESIVLRSPLVDTSVAAHMLGRPSLALPALVLSEFGQEIPTLAQLLGSGRKAITFAQLPVEQAAAYACAAADYTLRLAAAFEPLLRKQGAWGLFTELEMPLAPVLVRMERHGILVDVPLLQRMGRDLRQQMAGMEADIYDRVHQAGGPPTFNINSPKQLGEVLFEKLNLPHGRRTQTGWSTDAAVLEGLRGQDPSGVVERVLEYRELSKLVSTYLDALPALVNPRTGRIHTTFNQTGSATGRISSNDPNLQNIPVRTELGRRIRAAFIAPPGSLLLGADYSQIELRVLAHLSGDPALQAAFHAGEDIHAATASQVLGIPRDRVTPEHRRIAKAVNFGIVYGMSGFGLATRLDMDRKEADAFIAGYFARYPKVQDYMQETIQKARRDGYVQTLLGRRRYLPEVTAGNPNVRAAAERMAINMPVQGTAADIIKLAMLRVQERLDALHMRTMMLLQIHDELLFEAPQEEAGPLVALCQEVMPNVLRLDVPFTVEVKMGRSWGEME